METKKPTREEVKKKTLSEEFADFFGNLYFRWLEEKDYEDIEEYKKIIERELGYSIKRIKKRPFSIEIETSDNFLMTLKANSSGIELFRQAI